MQNGEYWNPILETLPREKLERLQLKKFKEIFTWAYDHSRFYHKLYADAGIEPGDIRTFDDIRKVPKIEKSLMRDVQGEGKEPFPYGDILCVPIEQVTDYRQTSGTTGQPVYQADTWQDWEYSTEAYCYALWAQGYRNTDRIFLPFGYNIFIAFWAYHYAGEKLGCEVIPGGVLNTEARVLKMKELKATAMGATPTYVLGMAETARKMGINPPTDLYIRKITVAGEPGHPETHGGGLGRQGLRPGGEHRDRPLGMGVPPTGWPAHQRGVLPGGGRGRGYGQDHYRTGAAWQDGGDRFQPRGPALHPVRR
jgi:phenylacetate-CoA ligase